MPEHAEKGTGIAVIDLEQPCLHFIGMSKTVPLCHLPSGHIAIDVCHFEESGFSCPRQAEHAGYGEREFRLTSGPKNVNTCAMLAQLSIASCAAFGHGPSGIPSSKLSEGSSRCQYGHPTKHQSCLKFESGRQTLASAVGTTLSLLGGLSNSWMPDPVEGAFVDYSRASCDQLAEIIKVTEPLPALKGKTKPSIEVEWCLHEKEKLTVVVNQHATWVTCRDCHSRWRAPQTVKNVNKTKAVKTGKKEAAASEALTTSSTSPAAQKMTRQEVEKLCKELQQRNQELQACQTYGQATLNQLRQELKEQSRVMEILEVTKSEYASMAMGQAYQIDQKFHDAKMYEYAKNRLQEMAEMRQLEELHSIVGRVNNDHARGSC